jgi:hypothetical protein
MTDKVFLFVSANVRYWEDATVSGFEDTDGTLIPFRVGDLWNPTIDLDEGFVVNWPIGTTASINYKVCDAGEYWLADSEGKKTHKWSGYYVPDRFLCHGDTGYGDYITLEIGSDGKILNYRKPAIDLSNWEAV